MALTLNSYQCYSTSLILSTLTSLPFGRICLELAYKGGERKPMSDWVEAQNKFSSTLFALLLAKASLESRPHDLVTF
jgi:hypothetical protein